MMKRIKHLRLVLVLFIGAGISTYLQSQCTIQRIIEKEVGLNFQNEMVVRDSTIFHYDEEGHLQYSENWGKLYNNKILRIEYAIENGQIVQEKLIMNEKYFAKDYFAAHMPPPKCRERLLVDSTGEVLLREDLSEELYSMKNWMGIDVQQRMRYANYQMGLTGNPRLYYVYPTKNGIVTLDQIDVITFNEQGDQVKIGRINADGYGYSESIYEYTYDDCGEWAEKYRLGENGERYLEVIRTIEYR